MDSEPLDVRVSDDDLEDIMHDIESDPFRWLPFRMPEKVPMWRLAKFALRGDRREAQFFVGRESEIRMVERLCREMIDSVRSGDFAVDGPTLLFQGAPGAGKTSILKELVRRWNAVPKGERDRRRTPIVVRRSFRQLADPVGVATAIAIAVRPMVEEVSRTTGYKERRVGGGGKLEVGGAIVPAKGSVGSEATYVTGKTVIPPDLDFETLAKTFPPKDWTRPVVLMVDEIQNVRKFPDMDHSVISDLQLTMYDLPIVPLYAGLGDSLTALRECGISPRLSQGHRRTIGCLEPGDPGEAAKNMLKEFADGPAPADLDFWAREIERISDRWPMHLHNAMTALARGLVEAERNLAEVDIDGIIELAERWRWDSYVERAKTDLMRAANGLVAKVMASLPNEGKTENELIGEIARLGRPRDDYGNMGYRLVGVDPDGFFTHLLHQGALIEGEDERFTCPIPSFRSFLMERGGEPPPPSDGPDESTDNDGGIGDGP